ncbi:polyprotein, partial [Trifolium medium]|nr:polyprotein [Trifolium medium]
MQNTHSIDASYTLQFHSLSEQKADDVLAALPKDLASLLHSYWHVFDEPTGLPPPRIQDHSIPLLAGSNPVK